MNRTVIKRDETEQRRDDMEEIYLYAWEKKLKSKRTHPILRWSYGMRGAGLDNYPTNISRCQLLLPCLG